MFKVIHVVWEWNDVVGWKADGQVRIQTINQSPFFFLSTFVFLSFFLVRWFQYDFRNVNALFESLSVGCFTTSENIILKIKKCKKNVNKKKKIFFSTTQFHQNLFLLSFEFAHICVFLGLRLKAT